MEKEKVKEVHELMSKRNNLRNRIGDFACRKRELEGLSTIAAEGGCVITISHFDGPVIAEYFKEAVEKSLEFLDKRLETVNEDLNAL